MGLNEGLCVGGPGADLARLGLLVRELEETTRELLQEAKGIQALERNARRILASVRMLRLNLSDALDQEQG
jgi:hypothetical protein